MENFLEGLMFRSRWLMAPMYLGLVGGLVLLLVKFMQEFTHTVANILVSTPQDMILALLSLVDLTLVSNLLLMIIFSGYENFVSKIDVAGHVDRPDWMGKVDYSGLKIKLIGSIVAISAIDLLKAFVHISNRTNQLGSIELSWMLAIHFLFIVTGVLFAWMDKIAEPH